MSANGVQTISPLPSPTEVAQLHVLGFYIGNRTRSHLNIAQLSPGRSAPHGVPRPVTFSHSDQV